MSRDFFSLYQNVLTTDTCQQIIDRFEASNEKQPGLVGDGSQTGSINPRVKKTTELILDDHPAWADVLNLTQESIRLHLPKYIEPWAASLRVELQREVVRIQKYEVGDFFDWHSDNIGGSLRRVVTVIWYLNTVAEGGETEYVWQQARIKPIGGCMLFCPVGWTYFHRGAPPISEPKYIMITQLNQALPQGASETN